MIDREEEVKQLEYEVLPRSPLEILRIIIIDKRVNPYLIGTPVGMIYLRDDKEKTFWISTLEIMNEKLQRRELNL